MRLDRLIHWILLAVTIEAFVGGGGRLFELGPITLRMTLFGCAVLVSAITVATCKSDSTLNLALSLTAIEGLLLAAGIARGLSNTASLDHALIDVRQLLYFAICPFFAIAIRKQSDVKVLARIVRVAAVVLAVSYLIAWLAIVLGLVDFLYWYQVLNDTDEFFFRGESFFFYKGFFYLCIGVIFFLSTPTRRSLALAGLLYVALLLTLTRGFLICTSVAAISMIASRNRRLLVMLSPLVLLAIVAAFLFLPGTDPLIASQRLESNSVRLDDTAFFLENLDFSMFFLGEGFGIFLNDRLNVENTYMWLFYKQGILGLLFWFIPFLIVCVDYRKARHNLEGRRLADAFFFSTCFLFLQTATNPFLNNSIGMVFLFISMFSMRVLAYPEQATRSELRIAIA